MASNIEYVKDASDRERKSNYILKQDSKLLLFIFTCLFFLFRSIDMSYRDPIVWLFYYSRNWVLLTFPYIAIRNSPINVSSSGNRSE